jgi:hypothetical protein
MTLIIGLNFSNKLYLAGDTRLSRSVGTNEPIRIDNILKLSPVWCREIKTQSFFNNDSIAMAVAGDVAFATYLYQVVVKALNERKLNTDIRIFADEILPFIQEMTNEWLKTKPYMGCAIIFSGMTQNRKKKISVEKIKKLIDIFNRQVEKDRPGKERFLKETLPNDPTWQQLASKIKKDTGKSVVEMLSAGETPTIAEWIRKAVDTNSDEIDMPDSLIVGIDIRPKEGILKKEVAEWGEFIAYGAGLTQNDLSESLVSTLDLSHVKEEKESPYLFEGAIITTEIKSIATERNIGSIGGSVMLMPTLSNGKIELMGNGLIEQNGVPGLAMMGHHVPLIPFHAIRTAPEPSNEKAEM